ncbi:MAG: hypothetical protein ACXWDO_07780 [Bacteroidia bacterium]
MTAKQSTEPIKLVRKTIESYDITKSDETMHLAIDLARFIKENKLFQNIQGKEYVNVEGWQYAGSRLGILPVVEDVTNVIVDGEIKYQAKVKLLNLRTDQVIGAGFAMCSNKESGKKIYQEYAIASMAQTRAIGKAYRNILAWIVRAAGYEPTPAEEMESHFETVMENRMESYVNSHQKEPASTLKASAAPQEESPFIPEIVHATPKQKEQIIKLLNNTVISAEEKSKMLLSINSLTEDRAKQAISKLKKTIEERETKNESAAA